MGPIEIPGGHVDVPLCDGALDFVDPDPAGGQRGRIHLDPHRVLLGSETCTCETPLTMEMRCARRVWAYSSTAESGSVGELRARKRTGESAGLTFRMVGGLGMFAGN